MRKPTQSEIDSFPAEAESLIAGTRSQQQSLIDGNKYDLGWTQGQHLLIAGATGQGLGCAIATAAIGLAGNGGSVTIVSRDLSRSLGYSTGCVMQAMADSAGLFDRFHWLNDGLALEGDGLERIVGALKSAGARDVVYINTVAAASSGLLPGYPPVYVKDVDDEGLFHWKLMPLSEKSIDLTRHIMGTMAVRFPYELEKAGIKVRATAFADWRASLDKISRDPNQAEYGRNGAYSTSLYLPKDILQQETSSAYGTGRIVLDAFFPTMKTRALGFIPGGIAMAGLLDRLMRLEGKARVDVPELGLQMLHHVGRALNDNHYDPFPRLDSPESGLDLYFYEVMSRLDDDPCSDFYYQRWIGDSA